MIIPNSETEQDVLNNIQLLTLQYCRDKGVPTDESTVISQEVFNLLFNRVANFNTMINIVEPTELLTQQINQIPIEQSLNIFQTEAKKSEVQSIIFDKEKWNLTDAKAWLKKKDYKLDVDEKENTYRFRQNDPSNYKTMRTDSWGKGIKVIYGIK